MRILLILALIVVAVRNALQWWAWKVEDFCDWFHDQDWL